MLQAGAQAASPIAVGAAAQKMSAAVESSGRLLQLAVHFDTTASMYAALAQVRRDIEGLAASLERTYGASGELQMRLSANGDYCDAESAYVFMGQERWGRPDELVEFIQHVGKTYGGDLPEAYEVALHRISQYDWCARSAKALVFVADDVPHPPAYALNTERLDWRDAVRLLAVRGVPIYAVQCLGRTYADAFYKEMADVTGGQHLRLEQLRDVGNLLQAVVAQHAGSLTEAEGSEPLSSNMRGLIAQLGGSATSALSSPPSHGDGEARSGPPGSALRARFQTFRVGASPAEIREFVSSLGIEFEKGRGFYEFVKPSEQVQAHKEIVLFCRERGEVILGTEAREALRLPSDGTVRVKRSALPAGFAVFIQSTSVNRVLPAGSEFLYEVPTDR